jgi:hypothetical protein
MIGSISRPPGRRLGKCARPPKKAVPANVEKVQSKIRARLGVQGLAVSHGVRVAGAAGEPFEEYPRDQNTRGGCVFRFDEPYIPVGPRDEFRGGDRSARPVISI